MMYQLKPCPFCGSEEIIILRNVNKGNFACECGNCSAQVPNLNNTRYNKEEAVRAWNTRAEAD